MTKICKNCGRAKIKHHQYIYCNSINDKKFEAEDIIIENASDIPKLLSGNIKTFAKIVSKPQNFNLSKLQMKKMNSPAYWEDHIKEFIRIIFEDLGIDENTWDTLEIKEIINRRAGKSLSLIWK
ncbi:MAG: hypothetical protein IH948_00060 [Bacteroidetes bacterium]|nr:hypothetical protein [Bacteroidota bacterium]